MFKFDYKLVHIRVALNRSFYWFVHIVQNDILRSWCYHLHQFIHRSSNIWTISFIWFSSWIYGSFESVHGFGSVWNYYKVIAFVIILEKIIKLTILEQRLAVNTKYPGHCGQVWTKQEIQLLLNLKRKTLLDKLYVNTVITERSPGPYGQVWRAQKLNWS